MDSVSQGCLSILSSASPTPFTSLSFVTISWLLTMWFKKHFLTFNENVHLLVRPGGCFCMLHNIFFRPLTCVRLYVCIVFFIPSCWVILAAISLICFSSALTKNSIVLSTVLPSCSPFSLFHTPPLSPLLKLLCYFGRKCGQSAQAAAPTCHLYFLVYLLRWLVDADME